MVIQAVTILLVLRAHGASEQLKSPDTCVAPVASVKNGLTHQKICTSSKKNTALLNQQPPNPAVAKVSQVYYSPNKGILVSTAGYGAAAFNFATDKPIELIDGGGLLYLLDEHAGIQARIIMPED